MEPQSTPLPPPPPPTAQPARPEPPAAAPPGPPGGAAPGGASERPSRTPQPAKAPAGTPAAGAGNGATRKPARKAQPAAGTPGAGPSGAARGQTRGGRGGSQRPLPRRHKGLRAAQARPRASQPKPGTGRTRRFIRGDVPEALWAMFSHLAADILEEILSAARDAGGPDAHEQVVAPIAALLGLPLRVLAEPRGGKETTKRLNRMIAIFEAFARGELRDAPDGAARSATHSRRQLTEEARLAGRIQQAAEKGGISMAARRLVDGTLADPGKPAVLERLRELNPAAAPPVVLKCDAPGLQVDSVLVMRVLERIKVHYLGKAAGPSGWTFKMILAVTGGSARGFEATVGFVNLILSGMLPRDCGLLDSVLIALEKLNGDVRPIAIGEVWYRLAAMCAMEAVGKELGRTLAPLQVGVGVPSGAETVAHSISAALEKDPDCIVLTADEKNAFNEIFRDPIARALLKFSPELYPLFQFGYGGPTLLHVVGAAPGTVIESQRGVRQGDPLGPLFFALGFHEVLTRIAAEVPEAPHMSYLDDFTAVGRGPAIRKVLGRLLGDGPGSAKSIGLTMVPRKSGVYGASAAAREECRLIEQSTGVPHRKRGVTVVGAHIGEDDFVTDQLTASAQKVIRLVDKLMSLPSPLLQQTKFQMLRQSLAVRLTHHQRTTPWRLLANATQAVEGAVVDAAASIFELQDVGGQDEARARRQLTLPLRHAGFGLRRTSAAEAKAALLAGIGAADTAVAAGPDTFRRLDGPLKPQLQEYWDDVRAECPDVAKLAAKVADKLGGGASSDIGSEAVRELLPRLQHVVARSVADADGKDFLEKLDLDSVDGKLAAARIRSSRGTPAGAWKLAMPGRHTTIGDRNFKAAGRHHFGLRVSSPVDMPVCTCKRGKEHGGRADHAMMCTEVGGIISKRHDNYYETLRQLCSRAGLCSSNEVPYRKLRRAEGGEAGAKGKHRSDILTVLPGGRHVMIDVTVVHPLQSKFLNTASREDGVVAKAAAREKVVEWQQFTDHPAYEFVPFALETYGKLDAAAEAFVRELGEIAAASGRISKSRFVMNAYKALSCSLQMGNGHVYASSLTSIVRQSGKNFLCGFDAPVDLL